MAYYGQPNKANGAVISDSNNTIDNILVSNTNGSGTITLHEELLQLANQGANFNAKGICLNDYANLEPNTDIFDGYQASVGDVILLNAPTTQINNGLVVFNGIGVAFSRSSDMPVGDQISGTTVSLDVSATYGNGAVLFCNSPYPAIIGTSDITFVDKSGSNIVSSNSVEAVFDAETDTIKLQTTDETANTYGYFNTFGNNSKPQLDSISYTNSGGDIGFFAGADAEAPSVTVAINNSQLTQNCHVQLLGSVDAPKVTTVVPNSTAQGQIVKGIDTNGNITFADNFFALTPFDTLEDYEMPNNQPVVCMVNNLNITLPSAANARDGYFYNVRLSDSAIKCIITAGSGATINNQTISSSPAFTLAGLLASVIFQYKSTGLTTGRYDFVDITYPNNSTDAFPLGYTPYQMTNNRSILVRISNANITLPIADHTAGGQTYSIKLAEFEADGITPVTNCLINAGTGTTIQGGSITLAGTEQQVGFEYNGFQNSYSPC